MSYKKRKFSLSLVILIFISSILLTGFAKVPVKPKELTSFEIQKTKKEIYKAGVKALKALKYKIKKKKKNTYLQGQEVTFLIFRILSTPQGNLAEGTQHDYRASMWIEPLSETSTRVDILVTEKVYDVKPNKNPQLKETNRKESREQKIRDKLKKILGIN
jgi:hypothetical protein